MIFSESPDQQGGDERAGAWWKLSADDNRLDTQRSLSGSITFYWWCWRFPNCSKNRASPASGF
jgi:hypothetical protein